MYRCFVEYEAPAWIRQSITTTDRGSEFTISGSVHRPNTSRPFLPIGCSRFNRLSVRKGCQVSANSPQVYDILFP